MEDGPKLHGKKAEMVIMDDIQDHITDALLYGTSMPKEQSITATEVMMRQKELDYAKLYGGSVTGRFSAGRAHGKSLLQQQYIKQSLASLQIPSSSNPLGRARETEFAFPAGVFQTEHQRLMMMPDEIKPPKTAREDRHFLCLTVTEYQDFSECIQRGCYLNKDGNHCKLKNAKTKKLKNLRYNIKRSKYLMASLIWQAQLAIIEREITKRRGVPRHEFTQS